MPKYRKKPIEIEAVLWTGENLDEVFELVDFDNLPQAPDDLHINPGIGHVPATAQLEIPTLEGTMRAEPGDWIIKGVADEVYPVKPEIFAETYELAEEKCGKPTVQAGTDGHCKRPKGHTGACVDA